MFTFVTADVLTNRPIEQITLLSTKCKVHLLDSTSATSVWYLDWLAVISKYI